MMRTGVDDEDRWMAVPGAAFKVVVMCSFFGRDTLIPTHSTSHTAHHTTHSTPQHTIHSTAHHTQHSTAQPTGRALMDRGNVPMVISTALSNMCVFTPHTPRSTTGVLCPYLYFTIAGALEARGMSPQRVMPGAETLNGCDRISEVSGGRVMYKVIAVPCRDLGLIKAAFADAHTGLHAGVGTLACTR